METKPRPERSRGWYAAGTFFSVLACIAAVVAHIDARIGYPLAFLFTMWGLLSLTRPSWDRQDQRLRVVMVNLSAFLTQLAILFVGMSTAS